MISPQHLFRESKIENISAYEILKTSSSVNSNFLFKAILWSALRLLPVQNITSESLKFLASQEALEVMCFSQSVSQRLDCCYFSEKSYLVRKIIQGEKVIQ